MRAAVVLVGLVLTSGVALAEAVPSATAPAPGADVKAGAGAPKAVAARKDRRMHRARAMAKPAKTDKADTADDALASCLQLWEPATHMTHRQWARACRRVDERIKAAAVLTHAISIDR